MHISVIRPYHENVRSILSPQRRFATGLPPPPASFVDMDIASIRAATVTSSGHANNRTFANGSAAAHRQSAVSNALSSILRYPPSGIRPLAFPLP